MQSFHGFTLLQAGLTDRGPAQLLRHTASGAQLLWIKAPVSEPVFSISFPGASGDDLGGAHVLEHLIFRGARQFPADPLYPALTAGEMVSFLNASARPGYTTFHAAAPTAAALTRVAEVLLEAVFHPRLTAAAFDAEAWSLPPGAAAPQGVILSEMRDHLAQPQAALALALRRAVLNGLPEAHNQSGDPALLAQLTLAATRALHGQIFTPGNAFLTLTGAGDFSALQRLIESALPPGPGSLPSPAAQARPLPRLDLPHPSGGLWGLAWLLPGDLPLALLLLLENLLYQGADPALLRAPGALRGPASGLQADTAQPFMTLALREGAAAPDLRRLARSLTVEDLHRAARQALQVWYDDEVFPRRPTGLRFTDPLLPRWLAGGDPFEGLNTGAELRARAAAPQQSLRQLQDLLENLAVTPALCAEVHLTPATAPTFPPPLALPVHSVPLVPLNIRSAESEIPDLPRSLELQIPGDRLARLRLAFCAAPQDADSLPALAAALQAGLRRDPQISALAPGISVAPLAGTWGAALVLAASALPEDFEGLCARLARALAAPDLTSAPLADLRGLMAQRPQAVIGLRLRARLSIPAFWADRMAGPGRLMAPPPGDLSEVWRRLRLRGGALVTAGGAERVAHGLRTELALKTARPAALPAPLPLPAGDGFAVNSAFHAVGLGFTAPRPAPARAALRAIEAEYLWPQIRTAGGAYGLRIESAASGQSVIFSARDPHLLRSLQVMRNAGAWLRRAADAEMMQRSRRGAAGQILTPATPQMVLQNALAKALGDADGEAMAQAELQALREMDLADFRIAAEALDAALHSAAPVVFGPEASLRGALEEEPGLFTLHSDR